MIKIKTKMENGITLIALIITIIILVILAAVSIRAAYNSGIIDYSINGTQKYIEGEKKEESIISGMQSLIESVENKLEGEEQQNEYTVLYNDGSNGPAYVLKSTGELFSISGSDDLQRLFSF